jgi:hypothetical protein
MRLMGGSGRAAISVSEKLLVQRLGVGCGSCDVSIASGFVGASGKLQSEEKYEQARKLVIVAENAWETANSK